MICNKENNEKNLTYYKCWCGRLFYQENSTNERLKLEKFWYVTDKKAMKKVVNIITWLYNSVMKNLTVMNRDPKKLFMLNFLHIIKNS